MTVADELGALKPYFADGVAETEQEKMDELYAIFHRDFFENTVIIDGIPLKVKPYLYKNSKKDNLPVDFERYYEKFVHVITRTIKGGMYKTSGKIREFREERANRVHWIRPILENKEDKRITYFQYIEDDGTLRDYYWYRGKQYIVIVEYIQPDYALITGFCVDCDNQPYYQNKYINREK